MTFLLYIFFVKIQATFSGFQIYIIWKVPLFNAKIREIKNLNLNIKFITNIAF